MRRWATLAGAATWLVIAGAILAVCASPVDTTAGLTPWPLLGVSAVAAALTLAEAVSALPAAAGYVVTHMAGVLVVASVVEWPRNPWQWVGLQALGGPSGGAGAHPTVLYAIAVALTWELTYASLWLVVREKRAWLAVALVVAVVVLAAHPSGRDGYMAAITIAGLAVVATMTAWSRRQARSRRLRTGAWMRLAPATVVPLSAVIVAVAWALPVPAGLGHAATRGIFRLPSFASLPFLHSSTGARPALTDVSTLSGFGPTLPVGGRFDPSTAPVLEGQIPASAPPPYWRGAVYDRYADGAWHMLPARRVIVPPNAWLPGTSPRAVTAVTATMTLLRPSSTLLTDGMPLRLGVRAAVSLASGTSSADVLTAAPAQGLIVGTYTTVSRASVRSFGPAPALPPAERVADLALPPLPGRVAALAARLAAGASDPGARAAAILRYLRAGSFVYDTAPPQPPGGVDPASYFLFTSKRGFCTQFATAMVVLAREDGIPARLVTGYVSGRFDGARYVVTAADAHAWAELWLPGRGWTTYDPTPGFAASGPARAGAGASAASAHTPPPSHRNTAGAASGHTTTSAGSGHRSGGLKRPGARSAHDVGADLPIALAAALLAIVVGFGILIAYRRLGARGDIGALYERMYRLARLLHAGPRCGQTALEWAADLAVRFPDDEEAVLTLTRLYVRQRYSRQTLDPADLSVARKCWRTLRRRWTKRLVARRPRPGSATVDLPA